MEVRRNKKVIVVSLVLLIVLISGASYALWVSVFKDTKTNKILSACFNITMENESDDISLENQFPILDEEGKKLTPYKFSIKNTCDTYANLIISLEMLNGTTLNSNYVKIQLNEETPILLGSLDKTKVTINNSTERRIIKTDGIRGKSSKDYTLRIWMDEKVTLEDDAQNKVLTSKIVVEGIQGVNPEETTLAKLQSLNSNIKLMKV